MEPVEYRIVLSLQAALQAIAVAAGFFYDVQGFAVKLDANSTVEDLIGDSRARPFYVLEATADAFEYQKAYRVNVTMPIKIHAVHDSDVTKDESWIQTYYRLQADIEKAVAKDIRRGELATDTRILTREFQTFNGSQVWATSHLEILVPRIYGAPNG